MKISLFILCVIILITLVIGAYLSAKDLGYVGSISSTNNAILSGNPMIPANAINQSAANASYSIEVEYNQTIGKYLANGSGYTLYYYKLDKQGTNTSVCNSGCAIAWPPFYTPTLKLAPNLTSSSFSTITRMDGNRQITYNGYPLYIFSGDSGPGQLSGQGLGGVWHAAVLNLT